MKIVFNLHDVGLGNNGGSRTLIKCGETFASLGHEVIMYSNIKSGYSWHKPVGIKMLVCKSPPEADIAIATGFKSVNSTIKQKASHRVYYIRGYELWQARESQLVDSFRRLPCIVNSQWLQSRLADFNIESNLVYPGLDFDIFKDKNELRKNLVGALFHSRHKTKRHQDAIEAAKSTGYECKLVNKHLIGASPLEMNDFYNKCKVWVSPSESEGLHNCPMEASLCGCALVVTNHARSGTQDFAIHEKTALVYEKRNTKQAGKYICELMINDSMRNMIVANMHHLLKTKIGNRRDNMINFIKVAMS